MVTNCFPLIAQWGRADSLVLPRVLEKHWGQRELSLFMAPLGCQWEGLQDSWYCSAFSVCLLHFWALVGFCVPLHTVIFGFLEAP